MTRHLYLMLMNRPMNVWPCSYYSRLREEFPDRLIASYSVMPSPKVVMVQISRDADDLHDNPLCADVVVKIKMVEINDVDKMVNLLVRIESSGLKRNGGAVQRSTSDPPPCGGLHDDVLHRQRGAGRHLLQRARHQVADLRRPQPPRITHHVWRHHLPKV